MPLDKNEKKLIEKLVTALQLLKVPDSEIEFVKNATVVDRNFLEDAGKIFDNTEACQVCQRAFHSWRKSLDDDTVLSFIDEWIAWKKESIGSGSKARVVKMKKRG